MAGQPGAGKTQIADLMQAVPDRRGGAVRVGTLSATGVSATWWSRRWPTRTASALPPVRTGPPVTIE
ncbi:zeta toxin family protein [Streptomyces ipomoeae]|uniref:zeta toxin family protein n=1 Tax=Streptomyces ipomoeae TaxID=103232 RepID=UPI0006626465|nr:zeta toxin family protein [Streptomyces ipomoeae]MDX2697993.1 zeta toxin family protein [Streptomyces ipomoeae]MDX2843266.1 zeta toxin family protein [Streptomyces ipomoeae]